MKVRFVGQRMRVNSFGVFEPGKTYDVKEEIGKQLLSVPVLFEAVKPQPEPKKKNKK